MKPQNEKKKKIPQKLHTFSFSVFITSDPRYHHRQTEEN